MTTTIYDVCGIGNAIVDVLSFTDDNFLQAHELIKGGMMLVDAERAEYLYGFMDNATESSGGSVANTVAAFASLGGMPAFIGKVRNDQLGEIFRHDLRAVGVHFDTPPITSGKPTARCLIFITPDGQRTMNTYIGACADVDEKDINDALIARSKITYIEGFLWDQPGAKDAIRKAVKFAKLKGREVAFTLSDSFCVERHRQEFHELITEIDILFANEEEIKSLFETHDFDAAKRKIKGRCPTAVLTRGEKGCVVVMKDAEVQMDGERVAEVLDTTGAGDLFAAGFLYGHTQGWAPIKSAKLGNVCAAHIIQQLGARSTKPLKELLK